MLEQHDKKMYFYFTGLPFSLYNKYTKKTDWFMAIITFMSDFGWRDPYVASIKAKILSLNHNIHIIDISHEIEHFNIPHAAYVMRNVFRDFPKGTVHLVCVNTPMTGREKMVALKLEEHYFVGMDTGFFSLLSDKLPSVIVELRKDDKYAAVFPERSTLATSAVSLASGSSIYNMGIELTELGSMMLPQVKITKNQIWGRVIHIDHYGNLITNITLDMFDKVHDARSYTVMFSREQLEIISNTYNSVESGECVAVFNSSGNLEIAICHGNASELLGLQYDSQIQIRFVD
jgi:S-adenosylmethionine hydrolase